MRNFFSFFFFLDSHWVDKLLQNQKEDAWQFIFCFSHCVCSGIVPEHNRARWTPADCCRGRSWKDVLCTYTYFFSLPSSTTLSFISLLLFFSFHFPLLSTICYHIRTRIFGVRAPLDVRTATHFWGVRFAYVQTFDTSVKCYYWSIHTWNHFGFIFRSMYQKVLASVPLLELWCSTDAAQALINLKWKARWTCVQKRMATTTCEFVFAFYFSKKE